MFLLRGKLPLEIFDVLLSALEGVSHSHIKTIDYIDYGLQYLLEQNQAKVVIYLENVLTKNTELSIKQFDSTLSYLQQKDNILLNQIVTKWFLSGENNLCNAIREMVTDGMVLSADTNQLKEQNSRTHLFVIKKAIGWLFRRHIGLISFIMSMIDVIDSNTANEVEDLLFDPLLISYPGSARKYLSSIDESRSKAKEMVQKLFNRLGQYHRDVENAWNIKELHPSQAQREAYYRFHDQEMLKAMEKARKNSAFLSLVSEIVILYGEKSVTYHPKIDNTKEYTRHEMNLQKTKHSIEHPSIDFIDPHGLDYMLSVFRYEPLKHEVNH